MQVTVETTEGLNRKLTITIPSDQIEPRVTAKLREIAKNRRFDGFRKGKVPVSIVERMYGSSVREDVQFEAMQYHLFEAVQQEKLKTVGTPRVELIEGKKGGDLVYNGYIEIYPEFEVKNLEQIKIEKPTSEVTDADIEEMIQTLRKQQSTWTESAADKTVALDDRVTIDFDGSIDGVPFDGGKAESFSLTLGEGRMIPGFEDGLLGKKSGDAFDLKVNFPDDYHVETLKGKEALFAVKLHKIETRELPVVDDAFVAKFGVTEGGIDALKLEVSKNMSRELKQAISSKVKQQVLDGLVEMNPIDLPEGLVQSEIDVQREQAAERFGSNVDGLPRELFETQAKKRVASALLLGELITVQEIKLDDSRMDQVIDNMSSAYESPEEVRNYYKSDKQMQAQLRNFTLEEQAIDFILDKAEVTEKKYKFSELMDNLR